MREEAAAGAAERRIKPGWKPKRVATAMVNARPPAVPATLNLSLEEYFAAAGVMGLLAAQGDECDPEWASEWALDFGEKMAAKARARRNTR